MIERIDPGPRMSKAVVHNDTIYTCGHVADAASDVAGQTFLILEAIEYVLTRAGSDKSKVLSATIWLADIAAFDEMNAVWDAWISPGNPPARATVQAKLAGPRYLVEIAVIAAR